MARNTKLHPFITIGLVGIAVVNVVHRFFYTLPDVLVIPLLIASIALLIVGGFRQGKNKES